MWIAAAQFQDCPAKFVRNPLTQVLAFFAPGIQADFKFEKIGRNLIGHIHPPEVMNQFALENKHKRAIRHDGLPKGDQWAAINSIASKIGCTPETLRLWVRQ